MDDDRRSRAMKYIDQQLAVERRYGKPSRLSKSAYESLVRRVVRALPKISQSASLRRTRSHAVR